MSNHDSLPRSAVGIVHSGGPVCACRQQPQVVVVVQQGQVSHPPLVALVHHRGHGGLQGARGNGNDEQGAIIRVPVCQSSVLTVRAVTAYSDYERTTLHIFELPCIRVLDFS